MTERLSLLATALLVPLLVARRGADFKAYAAQILLLVCLFSLGPRIFRAGDWRRTAGTLLPAAALLLSVWTSSLTSAAWPLREALRTTIFSSALFLAWAALSLRSLGRLTAIWTFTTICVAGYAILQHFGFDPVEEFRLFHSRDRVFATFGNPDFLGAHLAFMLPLAAWLGHSAKSAVTRSVSLAAAGAGALALLWTGSRGAWLGAAGGVGIWAFFSFGRAGLLRWASRGLAAAALLLGLLALTGHLPYEHIFRRTDRPLLWRGTMEMIRQKPIAGWGFGSFPYEYTPFAPPDFARRMAADNTFAEHPHSEYLSLAAERGLIGLGAFLWLIAGVSRRALFLVRLGRGAAAGVLGSLGAILFHIAVDRNFPLASTAVPFWIACGLVLSPGNIVVTARPEPGRPTLFLAASFVLAALLSAWLLRPLWAFYRVAGEPDFLQTPPAISSTELSRRLSASERDPDLLFSLGNAHAREGHFLSAIECFRRASLLRPGWPAAFNNLGNCHFMLSQFPEAAAAYRAALALAPEHSDARFNLAFTLYHQRNIKGALEQCRILLKSDPGNHKALQLREQLSP